MKFEIRNKYDDSVMFEVEADSFVKAVEAKRADLRGANLTGADLSGANLSRQDLSATHYQVGHFLHSYDWGILPDNLTLELMRRDALICGDEAMQQWADGGECPFSNHIVRDFWFSENRALWYPGPPTMNDMELFRALCKEKEIKI